jgi:glycosyltransferase involved in cell wall biosynthesis
MKIILATGIYPPDIGGPATYVHALARELSKAGNDVTVVTYGSGFGIRDSDLGPWKVVYASRSGGPLLRWWRYARTLKRVASDVDVVEAFSSVSVGVPLMLARLEKPKKVLRLGGDFFWERYTDRGGALGLREWYAARPWSRWLMQKILRSFDHIIFSTRFEEELYERMYALPRHSVIENALPAGQPALHHRHEPFRLLFMGRFVWFKNLPALIATLPHILGTVLTFVGGGPEASRLRSQVKGLRLEGRVTFLPPVSGSDRAKLFLEQDLLVLPSLTELSPHVALEARASGLPVLLTEETGLSHELTQGMALRNLSASGEIAVAIREVMGRYNDVAREASLPAPKRGWEDVAKESLSLFVSL